MYIEDISIVNFKNLKEVNVEFSPKLNCFIGKNGSGKTNMLDALYYLSFCKSFSGSVDLLNVNHEESFFMLNGNYQRENTHENISCGLKRGLKKQFKRNSKIYKKLQEHIGLLPLVMITPGDVDLISGGSDERRKFMDGVISQYNQQYLNDLIRYNRALLQRNNLLKQFAGNRFYDPDLLEIWSVQLIDAGTRIHEERKEFVKKLIPVFQRYYSFISQDDEKVSLLHQSDLYEDSMERLLTNSIQKDRAFQFTTQGIHKDDLIFYLGEYPMKKLGSQGQMKTYFVALKLAQFDFVKEISGLKPILLLDDIFDKLDEFRVEQIVKVVAGEQFGQIFITDTNRSHLDAIIKKMDAGFYLFNVESGKVKRT